MIKSNYKGIDEAISIIEKNIQDLEAKCLQRTSDQNKITPKNKENTSQTKGPSQKKKKLSDKQKKPSVSVLLKRPSSKIQSKNKICKKDEKKSSDIPKSEASKKKTVQKISAHRSTFKTNVSDCQFAKATLCHALKVDVMKEDRRKRQEKEVEFLPFINEATQSKSHNIRVIIQQVLADMNSRPPSHFADKYITERDRFREVKEADIHQAIKNVERQISNRLES